MPPNEHGAGLSAGPVGGWMRGGAAAWGVRGEGAPRVDQVPGQLRAVAQGEAHGLAELDAPERRCEQRRERRVPGRPEDAQGERVAGVDQPGSMPIGTPWRHLRNTVLAS